MTGLIKAKKYDWKDSNMALFGSDTEKQVKKESAVTEKAWKAAGSEVGIKIWRVVKFKIEAWHAEDYGKFYNGDSYIILNTYKADDSEELEYDVHFWIGQYSTQDEYGTAAYKTVELDTFLDDKPIQHREVQGYESTLFKSYFKEITILKGGATTGFRHVKPEEYTPRLMHFKGERKHIEIKEVARNRASLNSNDVFILDLGLTVYQWTGKDANKDEKFKAMQYLQALKSERSGRPSIEHLDEDDVPSSHKFYDALTEDLEEQTAEEGDAADSTKVLFRLSDAGGKISFTEHKQGDISRSDFDSSDVFILDVKKEVIVWIGKNASTAERRNSMTYAHNYLMKTDHPLVPVTCLSEGKRPEQLDAAIAA